MKALALVDPGSGVINLDQPGTYVHRSVFTVSVANLVLIAVMVVIFGLALVLPFPKGHTYPPAAELPPGTDPGTLAGGPAPGHGAASRGSWSPDRRTLVPHRRAGAWYARHAERPPAAHVVRTAWEWSKKPQPRRYLSTRRGKSW